MKHLRKVMALVLAALVALVAATPAWADDPVPTNNQTLDAKISVSGLDNGDSVAFYQVLKFDQDASATGGWVNGTGFSLTTTEIQQILGLGDYAPGKPNAAQAGINEDLAGKIANMVKNADPAPAAKYTETAASNKAEHADPEAGLYMALVTPAVTGTIYNPVFVGADYKAQTPTDHSTWAVDMTDSYQPASMAKKDNVTTTKSAEDERTVDGTSTNYDNKSETVSVGDVLTFTVETEIPEFSNAYTAAAFQVKDSMTRGLQLQNAAKDGAATDTDNSIVVKVGSNKTSATALAATSGEKTNYTLTANGDGYTISFDKDYLLGLNSSQVVIIEYQAKITDAAASVNESDNTVVVSFSNNPNDTTSRTKEIDKTNHYTFDIDANLIGETPGDWVTTEVVKVGLDANGNEITTTTTTLHPGQTKVGALEGAKFKLYTAYTDANNNTPYTNSVLTADKHIVSTADGRLTIEGETTPGIRGLDAGTYYLVETEAPAGYVKMQSPVTIEIIPTFEDKEETIVDGTDTLKVTVKELKSYIVKINGAQTANYTMTNAADGSITSADHGDTVTGADSAGYITSSSGDDAAARYGKITNTQGVELPSTGGMGTRILYTIGGAMIVAGGIYLVAKRRLSAME